MEASEAPRRKHVADIPENLEEQAEKLVGLCQKLNLEVDQQQAR